MAPPESGPTREAAISTRSINQSANLRQRYSGAPPAPPFRPHASPPSGTRALLRGQGTRSRVASQVLGDRAAFRPPVKSRRVLPAVWPSLRRQTMRRYRFLPLISLLFLGVQQSASAQDVQVPAGTLLRCTLNEPDFSSKTSQGGAPVLCHVSMVQEFVRPAFPRGAYMAGHLEAEQEPGHFWGKGYLKLVFDRIRLPHTRVPIIAKGTQEH